MSAQMDRIFGQYGVPLDGAADVHRPPESPTVWTVGELADRPSADEEYIVGEGVLTRGGKLLIYAKSGAGKTTLVDHLGGALATGRPFLGRYAIDRPRRVLLVQGELSVPEMASHAQQLIGAGFGTDNLSTRAAAWWSINLWSARPARRRARCLASVGGGHAGPTHQHLRWPD